MFATIVGAQLQEDVYVHCTLLELDLANMKDKYTAH